MAPRANWKGYLKVGELSCPVALYTAASTADRVSFHTVNRATGNRIHRQFIDSETEEVVDKEGQVKGYETEQGRYVVLEPEEVAAAVPESDKTLAVEAFVACDSIDDVYFDRPYYLGPGNAAAAEAYGLIRNAMRIRKVAALAQTVLFRRVRTLLIRPHETGLIATTLNFDYEVRPAAQVFKDVKKIKIKGEMLDLAKHIIETKRGAFDPSAFEDRYDAAVAELVKAKIEGRKIRPKRAPPTTKVVDLMEALRQSAGGNAKSSSATPAAKARKTRAKSSASPRRKAG